MRHPSPVEHCSGDTAAASVAVTKGAESSSAPASPVIRDASVATRTTEAAVRYRLDLDGLRGAAIALVVVFHIWLGRVSGGVDVFLVLSGFFFTGLLMRQADSGAVRVWATIRRTLRRLLPALVIVLGAVVVATVLLRPITQWNDIAGQTLASAFYYQNWHLALAWSDYLAADPSVSPLQHLWSMSVQGQFYLAVITLIAVVTWACQAWNRSGLRGYPGLSGRPPALRPTLAVILTTLAVVSFLYATSGSAAHQGWNYYDSFARAWELLAGAVLAIAAPWLSPPRLLRILLAVAGVAIVAACGWLVDGANRFPGPAALIPVAAAAALILAGNNIGLSARPLPLRLLASRPMVELGRLAYALYLWHWPILIFYLAERGATTPGLTDGLVVIAVSLVLAYATNHCVEEPLRSPSNSAATSIGLPYRRGIGAVVTAVGIAVLAVGSGWQIAMDSPQPANYLSPAPYPGAEALTHGVRAPDAPMRPTLHEAPAENAYPSRDGCIADWDTRDVVTCDYGDTTAERTIAVVGSSHAEHWVPALDLLAKEHHFRIVVYLKMGCPLTVAEDATYKGQPISDCRDWSRDVLTRLGETHPEWVFTTGTRPSDDVGDETPQDYLDVWTELSKSGLNVLAVRDTPWLRRDGVRYRAIDCLANGGDRLSCGMKRADALDDINPAIEPAAAFPNIFPLDLTDAVCEPDICPVAAGNILIYHDEHHLTASYSRSLAPELGRQLQGVLMW